MTSRAHRRAVAAACAALAFACTTGAVRGLLERVAADAGSPTIELALELRGKVANVLRYRATHDEPLAVMIGDSTVLHDYLRPEVRKDVGRALARRLTDLEPRPRVRTVASPGLTAASAYWLAPDLIQARPQVVIVTANLAMLSDWWSYGVPELIRWFPADRLARPLFLPIQAEGLTADGYLLRLAAGRLVPLEAERWLAHERARVRRSRLALERALLGEHAAELPLVSARQTRRIHFQGEDRYAGALRGVATDHPHLGMLTALIDEFERHGVPVVVYVPPVSPAHFADPTNLSARLARSIDAIRTASRGAAFLDLHAALPESAFRDWQDHYTTDGDQSGMDQLAALLEPAVRRALTAARTEAD